MASASEKVRNRITGYAFFRRTLARQRQIECPHPYLAVTRAQGHGRPWARVRVRATAARCLNSSSAYADRTAGVDPRRHSSEQGARQPLVRGHVAVPGPRLLDDERRFEGHGPGHVVEVRRGRHHRFVDLGELLLGATAVNADDVLQILVALRHGWIDSEEAAQIDLAIGLDLKA